MSNTDPKDLLGLEDGVQPLTQSGQRAFGLTDGQGDPVVLKEEQPRLGLEDRVLILGEGGLARFDFATAGSPPDLRKDIASLEDAITNYNLSLDPFVSTTTQDSDLHYHFLNTKPYLAAYYDTHGEAWANPTLNNFSGYARDGFKYTNGVKDSNVQIIGVSTAGAKVYSRHPVSGWSVFSSQPALGTGNIGTLCIATPSGFIVWRQGGSLGTSFCHFNTSTWVWTYNAPASAGAVGNTGSGCAFDATHVYACGGGYVEKFNGTAWSNLTTGGALTGSPDHIWAQAADRLWCCAGGGTANLWYYNGSSWADRWSEIPAALPSLSLTSCREVWATALYVYAIVHASSTAKEYLVRYDGVTWSNLGALGTGTSGDFHNIWGTDDSHVWISGRNANASVYFWNGSTLSVQFTGPSTSGMIYQGHKLAGTGNLIVAGSFYTTANVVYETTDGVNWVSVSWPDSTPAIVFAGPVNFGNVVAPWAAESSGANRSSRSDFPNKALLVVTYLELVIFDLDTFDGVTPATLRVWMRFTLGNDASNYNALGRGSGAIQCFQMQNGMLAVGLKNTGWEQGRLHTVDFKGVTPTATFHLIGSDNEWVGGAGKDITSRNTNGIWSTSGSNRLATSEIRSLSMFTEGTTVHVAVTSGDAAVQVVDLLGNVVQKIATATGTNMGSGGMGNYRQVLFDDVGWLWIAVGSMIYRNCTDWREGYIWIDVADQRSGQINVGATILGLVAAKNDLYAATANGVYRIPKGTLASYLCYTAAGGGGRGRLNIAAAGEKIVGDNSAIQSLQAYTIQFTHGGGDVVFAYLAIATYCNSAGFGGFTLIRLFDDLVTQSFVWPNLIERWSFIGSVAQVY